MPEVVLDFSEVLSSVAHLPVAFQPLHQALLLLAVLERGSFEHQAVEAEDVVQLEEVLAFPLPLFQPRDWRFLPCLLAFLEALGESLDEQRSFPMDSQRKRKGKILSRIIMIGGQTSLKNHTFFSSRCPQEPFSKQQPKIQPGLLMGLAFYWCGANIPQMRPVALSMWR